MTMVQGKWTPAQVVGLIWSISYALFVCLFSYFAKRGDIAEAPILFLLYVVLPSVCLIVVFGRFRSGRVGTFILLGIATYLAAGIFSKQLVPEVRDAPFAISIALMAIGGPISLVRAMFQAHSASKIEAKGE